jgi:NADPH:quinone reductase-like Zn-dependent oxidoreductase
VCRLRRYGRPAASGVLEYEQVPRSYNCHPAAPASAAGEGEEEVLVAVHATGVNFADHAFVVAKPFVMRLMCGLFGPKWGVLGGDFAGRVVAGDEGDDNGGEAAAPLLSKKFAEGDRVVGFVDMISNGFRGAYSEFVRVPASQVVALPSSCSMIEAGACPLASITALQGLRLAAGGGDLDALEGKRVLVIGAAGGVGSFAVQLATIHGARVTGVCSTTSAESVTSLGAEAIIDYRKNPRWISDAAHRQRFDVVFQLASNASAWSLSGLLKRGGFLVQSSGEEGWLFGVGRVLTGFLVSPFLRCNVGVLFTDMNRRDLETVVGLMAQGQLRVPISQTFKLESEIPQAIAQFEKPGGKHGKIVLASERHHE